MSIRNPKKGHEIGHYLWEEFVKVSFEAGVQKRIILPKQQTYHSCVLREREQQSSNYSYVVCK